MTDEEQEIIWRALEAGRDVHLRLRLPWGQIVEGKVLSFVGAIELDGFPDPIPSYIAEALEINISPGPLPGIVESDSTSMAKKGRLPTWT